MALGSLGMPAPPPRFGRERKRLSEAASTITSETSLLGFRSEPEAQKEPLGGPEMTPGGDGDDECRPLPGKTRKTIKTG